MVVVQDGPQQENEKPLRIYGDPQKVEHAKQLVYDLIAEKEMEVNVSLIFPNIHMCTNRRFSIFNHKFQTQQQLMM